MEKNKLFRVIGVVIILLVISFVVSKFSGREGVIETLQEEIIYDADTTLPGDYKVDKDKNVVVKNGATLTIEGNLIIQGDLSCQNDPLSLVVKGTLQVEGTIRCHRSSELDLGDAGFGINIVAFGDVEFSESSALVSNGHVQIVDDATKLATTTQSIENFYNNAAADSGEGYRLGPFVPIEVSGKSTQGELRNNGKRFSLKYFVDRFISGASAQEAAKDIKGNPVPNTIKVGGTWIVGGFPAGPTPPNLDIPTPPKGIKKIILNFNFGTGKDMVLRKWELSGPDGRPGQDDINDNCNAKGGKGDDAFRMQVFADNLTIDSFTLNLGSGGQGGTAETKRDCNPGVARGGQGGAAGNLKMIAGKSFTITGEFRIRPGKGGLGGAAIAYGQDGDNGCPGEAGGDAQSYGGQGGDNKKGLKLTGQVTGKEFIIIEEIVGGQGGDATSNGGKGGNGTKSKCKGGNGGNADAAGGRGGDAVSKTLTSRGGDGGNVTAIAGHAGKGGNGDAKTPGGDGGKGGNANTVAGEGGAGRDSKGSEGNVLNEPGGNGGDGGDGCNEGKGGAGGKGNPPGQKGKDGKNLCLPIEKADTAVQVPGGETEKPTPTPEPKPTPTPEQEKSPTPSPKPEDSDLSVNQTSFSFEHEIGKTECPTPIGKVNITGTNGYSWKVIGQLPKWLSWEGSGQIPGSANLYFTCVLENYTTQDVSTTVKLQQYNKDGTAVANAVNLEVKGYIQAR